MFPCTNCGLCCQNIHHVEELKAFDLGNRTCQHFNPQNNGCNIYNTRPNICRVDTMFNLKYHKEFSQEEFYRLNAKACNNLQEAYGTDKSFRVKI